MKDEYEVRNQRRLDREQEKSESDPLIKAIFRDRADTLEWVLGD